MPPVGLGCQYAGIRRSDSQGGASEAEGEDGRANTVSSQQMRHRACTGTITANDYVVWVSAEFLDVAVDPLEGFDLVFETVVEAGDAGEETVGTDLGDVSIG